jgi:3-deoxy-D-manno-octulosonic acid (KDO) 8-phosphate synthase
MVAIVAAVLYLPAFLAEQAGLFSALRPPIAIQRVEWVQAVVAVIAIGLSVWLLRSGTVPTNAPPHLA